MQQLVCPNCGETVPAEQINIQEMVAVCSACHHMFSFSAPKAAGRLKRRKVKQPSSMVVHESDAHLHMEFRTNFRLDRNEAFIGTAGIAASFTFVTLIMLGVGDIPFIIPLVFGVVALFLFYLVGLVVYNKTHLDVQDDRVRISRKPLPGLNQDQEISLSGVVAIHSEETPISVKEGYDTPRYRVQAEYADGSRRTIINDVTQEYALYIAQRLDEVLGMGEEADISRLEDVQREADSDAGDLPASQQADRV